MEPETIRMLERLMVVIFAGMSLFLGYRLFAKGLVNAQKGEITINQFLKVKSVQFGPGIFFALFGAWILRTSFASPISVTSAHTLPSPKVEITPDGGQMAFNGSFSLRRDSTDSDPRTLIRAINTVSLEAKDYLDSRDGVTAKSILNKHIRSLIHSEWPSSPKLVEEFFSLIDRGLDIPTENPNLQNIKSAYEAQLDP